MTSTNSLSDNIVWMKYELLPEFAEVNGDILKNVK
jgi:hypothetical protein